MAIQIHYDGWLSLPAEARRHLDITTGSRLEIELIEDALILRPVRRAKDVAAAEVAAAAPSGSPDVAVEPAVPKRGPGRPRKASAAIPVPLVKVGGRRKELHTA